MKGILKTRTIVHRAALKQEELPKFLCDLREADIHATSRLALKFTMLTASRSGEALAATWGEIKLDESLRPSPSNA